MKPDVICLGSRPSEPKVYYLGTREQLFEKGILAAAPLNCVSPDCIDRLRKLLGQGSTLIDLRIAPL